MAPKTDAGPETNIHKLTTLREADAFDGVVGFSPDGRHLSVHWGWRLKLYETTRWQVVWTRPVKDNVSTTVWSPAGDLLALRDETKRIRLLDPRTGGAYATLETPNGFAIEAMTFSAKDRYLAAASAPTGELFVWEIPSVRRELARIGLDWGGTSGDSVSSSASLRRRPSSSDEPATNPPANVPVQQTEPPDFSPEWRQRRQAEIASAIPARTSNAPRRLLDLSSHFDFALSALPGEEPANNLASLPTGIQRLAGVDFDVRGGIVLRAAEIYRSFPPRTRAVPVGQACRRLHFLGATICGVPRGTKVGSMLMRCADGTTSELPLQYGVNIGDWWHGDGEPETKNPVVAWVGQNPVAARGHCHLHLYKVTWENPHPDQVVESLTFQSALSAAAPFLIAITAE